jgi:hypothetical protein
VEFKSFFFYTFGQLCLSFLVCLVFMTFLFFFLLLVKAFFLHISCVPRLRPLLFNDISITYKKILNMQKFRLVRFYLAEEVGRFLG